MKYKPSQSDLKLNLAPMIDVVFLLLIFFIVASTININQVQTNISLPETKVITNSGNSGIVVMITDKNNIYLNQKQVTYDNLKNKLKNRVDSNKQKPVTIYADKKVKFQFIIKVMDIVKKLNLKTISFSLLNKVSP